MHGGEVQAASDGKGKGATFTVTLPCCRCRILKRLAEVSPEVSAQLLNLRQQQNGAGDKNC
jgi:hypothetical protein